MSKRQKMQMADWLNWAALIAVGVFLGLALDGLVGLARIGAWASIVILVVGSVVCWFLYLLLDRVIEFFFTGSFSKPRQLQEPRRPLVLLMGLPVGILFGFVGAQFGLGDLLL